MEMTYEDSEFCTLYEFPSKAFLRLRFLQHNLKSFYKRFQGTLENLPVCLKWKELLADLSKHVEPLEQSKPVIILVGEKHSMIKDEQIVTNINRLGKDKFIKGTFPRKDLPTHVSADKPQVIIYRCSSDQVYQEINHLEEELPESWRNNIFLLLDGGGQPEHEERIMLEKMTSALSNTTWKDKIIINAPGQDLNPRISSHLEMFVLRKCKRIHGCIGAILSVQRKLGSIFNEESDIFSVITQFFQRKRLLYQDIIKFSSQRKDVQLLQEQIISLIQREVTNDFRTKFKMAAGDVHAILDEVKFEKECKSNISQTTWDSILSHLSEVYTEHQKGAKSMKTEKNTGQHSQMGKMSQSDQIAKLLMKDIEPVLSKVKQFLWCVHDRLRTLSHLQFELEGILESTINDGEKMSHKTVNFDFWTKKLMKMDDVQGCGDYFGTLVIFIAKENTIEEEQEVRKKIEKCLSGYPYDYDIKYSTKPRTFTNPNKDGAGHKNQQSCIKAGDKIRWVDGKGNVRHGTLGMFVMGNKDLSAYLVTNKHVVFGEGKCYICFQDESYQELGSVKWESCDGSLDIAAVKVNSNMTGNCILHYENFYGEQCSYVILKTNEHTIEDLVGNKVFKRGAETGLTEGIISSKSIQMKEEGIIKTHNTLISPLPGSTPEEPPFAKEGDSGSVVSLHTPDETTVEIMGMLIGEFEVRQTQEERELSMSQDSQEKLYLTFYMMDGLDKLNTLYGLDMKVET